MQAWLTRSTYGGVKEQTAQYEKGSYHVFDPIQWRKIPKEMTLEYKELEQRPAQPTADLKMQSQTHPRLMSSVAAGSAQTPSTPINGSTFNPMSMLMGNAGNDSNNQSHPSGRHAGLGYLSQLSHQQQNHPNTSGPLPQGEISGQTTGTTAIGTPSHGSA